MGRGWVWTAAFVMAPLLSGCAGCVLDAKNITDDAKSCEKQAREADYPQQALVAEFDKVSEKAGLDDEEGFDPDTAVRNFEAMDDTDARAMLWSLCLGIKGARCSAPTARLDSPPEPPRTCSIKKGDLSSTIDNPFLPE